MDQIIESIENGNKTSIFHKIQMQMILSCVQEIDVNSEILSSLTYKDVVKDFNYNKYIGIDVTLTKEEEVLLNIIKKLEKDLGDIDKKNKIKQQYQQTQKVESEWSMHGKNKIKVLLQHPNQIILIMLFSQYSYVLFLEVVIGVKNQSKV